MLERRCREKHSEQKRCESGLFLVRNEVVAPFQFRKDLTETE